MLTDVNNVHLPIMLESERQAVYRERKKHSFEDTDILCNYWK